jgi:hypothetical protein
MLIFDYCDIENHGWLEVSLNNSGLVKKMHKFQSSPKAYFQYNLHSEYDQLITIHQKCKLFPEYPNITHMKGHQDQDIPYDDLPLQSQLNV